MCYYPVYRYRSVSDGSFVRLGTIKGYPAAVGGRTYPYLLREARRLFGIDSEDVILVGPSPIGAADEPVREEATVIRS